MAAIETTQAAAQGRPAAAGRTAAAPARPAGLAIVCAAMALPGLLPLAAQAESAPERGELTLRGLSYQERQPGLERVHVSAPSVSLILPVGSEWSVSANAVIDAVSGASPRWHTAVSGASKMDDHRKAGELQVTRYFERGAISVGATSSDEHDYHSRAGSLQGRWSSLDNNTTWTAGIGFANDRMNPTNRVVQDESRHTTELLLGVSQVLTPLDVVQLNATHARGRGYYADPYKFPDNRPRSRHQSTLQGRWNHFFEPLDATLRLSYRYYTDSFGVRAHTLGGEFHKPLVDGWAVEPSLRFHTQRAASFYFDPVYDPALGEPFPPGYQAGGFYSPDTRLSAFGALTVGFKLVKHIGRDWTLDLKLEHYEQRGGWRAFGTGSPGLLPISARVLQAGVTWRW